MRKFLAVAVVIAGLTRGASAASAAPSLYDQAKLVRGADYSSLLVNTANQNQAVLDALITRNSQEGAWLPLYLNPTDPRPAVIIYANTRYSTVADNLARCGVVHSSAAVDECRYSRARGMALEAVAMGGAPFAFDAT